MGGKAWNRAPGRVRGEGYFMERNRLRRAGAFPFAWVFSAFAVAFLCAIVVCGTALAAPILKMGAEGHDVDVLQRNLREIGYEVELTGVFDEATYRAVVAFQRDEKLEATGTVDRVTWKTLGQRVGGGAKASSEDAQASGAKQPDREGPAERVKPPDRNAAPGRVKPPDKNAAAGRVMPPERDAATESVKPPEKDVAAESVKPPEKDTAAESVKPPEKDTSAESVKLPEEGKKQQERGARKRESKEEMTPPPASVPESGPFLPKAKAEAIIKTAKKYIGTRYQFGGTTPKGFDCSGFLQYVFRQNGFSIARTADEQYKLGKHVRKRAELVPGDLVFFSTYEKGASHCGIYLGKNQFIHVSSSRGVRIDSLDNEYWKPRWYGGKHIVKT